MPRHQLAALLPITHTGQQANDSRRLSRARRTPATIMESITVWAKPKPIAAKGDGDRNAPFAYPRDEKRVALAKRNGDVDASPGSGDRYRDCEWAFDRVLCPQISQEDVFEAGVPDFVKKAFAGANVAIVSECARQRSASQRILRSAR